MNPKKVETQANESKETLDLDMDYNFSNIDCDYYIHWAFTFTFGGQNIPGPASEMRWIWMEAMVRGDCSEETEEQLKVILRQQLEAIKDHDTVWSSDNPEPELVAEAWVRQEEAWERWTRFTKEFDRSKDIYRAIKEAFENYHYEAPSFWSETERQLWLISLKNQQQEKLGKRPPTEIRLLEGDSRMEGQLFHYQGKTYKLEPTIGRLLEVLLDEKPKSVGQLLLEVYGSRSHTNELKRRMHRRIHKLNASLSKIWGKPPQKRWVHQPCRRGEGFYQLTKPSRLPLE